MSDQNTKRGFTTAILHSDRRAAIEAFAARIEPPPVPPGDVLAESEPAAPSPPGPPKGDPE